MIENMPTQQKIDLFWKIINDGWSVTYAMSKAKITGLQYSTFLKQDKEARDRIAEYKKSKTEARRYSYIGVPLTLNQLKDAGLEDEYHKQVRRKEYEDRTRLEMQRILEFRAQQENPTLPIGK